MTTATVELATEGVKISLEVLRYLHENASNPDDANWLDVRVRIQYPGFAVDDRFDLTTQDFHRFRDLLAAQCQARSSRSEFSSIEPRISLSIETGRHGHFTVRGTVGTLIGDWKLEFRFDTDQTYLAACLKSLEAAILEFPVRDGRR